MTHHRDQWVTSYKMNTMTSWLRHHFRSLPVWSWPEMIFMGFSERRIFYWLTSHKKFLDITYRFSKTIAKLLLALKKMDLSLFVVFGVMLKFLFQNPNRLLNYKTRTLPNARRLHGLEGARWSRCALARALPKPRAPLEITLTWWWQEWVHFLACNF